MVRDAAQLYTIEGIAAGLIMILTAFFVVNATTVYTAGDSHISDMQLETLGSDALKMMDIPPDSSVTTTQMQAIIKDPVSIPNETFKTRFLNLTNNRTGLSSDYYQTSDSNMDNIQFSANVSYYNFASGTTESYPISFSRTLTGGEHAVRATKWVIVDKPLPGSVTKPRAVLVEVLMWRD
jgi:hypothetical protein